MRILIAPDKFKGSLSAREVAENIAAGLREVLPDAKIDIVPVADGGEGTAEAICEARGGSWLQCKAHDPIGREIDARYAWIEERKLAVMEMSEAAGMRRLSESERDSGRERNHYWSWRQRDKRWRIRNGEGAWVSIRLRTAAFAWLRRA